MKKSSRLEKWPKWVDRSLQGVTYWIGHRRCLYRDYPLAEGALVAEISNLIYGNLRGAYSLQCEVMYKTLLPQQAAPDPNILATKARADLVVAQKATDGNYTAKFAIEVKRAGAPTAQINSDLRRLAEVRRVHPDMRTFMFIVAEANRPKRFVDADGKSILGKKKIPNSGGHYRVRRTWKAAHAFSHVESAQYACLVEVYP